MLEGGAPGAVPASPAEQELGRLRAAFAVGAENPEYRFRRLLLDLDEGGGGWPSTTHSCMTMLMRAQPPI